MNDLLTVMGFTIRNKFRSKAFIITTIIFAVLISIGVHVPLIISAFDSDEPDLIGMAEDEIGIAAQMKTYFDSLDNSNVSIVILPAAATEAETVESAKAKINAGEIRGFLQTVSEEGAAFPSFKFLSKATMDFGMGSTLRSALQVVKTEHVVAELGLSGEQFAALSAPVRVDNVQITSTAEGGGRSEAETMIAYFMVYILMILLFMGVVMYGNMIAAEVTAEKSSRVMELLISSVAPIKQMFGKIFGICFVGISQLVFFFAIGIINLLLPHNQAMLSGINFNLSDVPVALIIYFIVFYFLGFFLYGTVFAALGSIVSRSEDLGQAIMPVTFLTLAGFYIGIFGLNAPNAALIVGTSFFPFFTPLIMFLRIGMSDPAAWEIALSIALLVASIIGMGWLASKIYRTGVLMYGKRPSLKQLSKAIKANKG